MCQASQSRRDPMSASQPRSQILAVVSGSLPGILPAPGARHAAPAALSARKDLAQHAESSADMCGTGIRLSAALTGRL